MRRLVSNLLICAGSSCRRSIEVHRLARCFCVVLQMLYDQAGILKALCDVYMLTGDQLLANAGLQARILCLECYLCQLRGWLSETV